MKKYLLLTLLLASCETKSASEKYDTAKSLALESSVKKATFGFGFRPGMTEAEAEAQKAKIRGTISDGIKLPIYGYIKPDDYHLGFANHKLANMQSWFLSVKEGEYQELKSLLAQQYGDVAKQYPHTVGDSEVISWFSGPVEIALEFDPVIGVSLEYTDVRLESQYMNENLRNTVRNDSLEKAEARKNL